MFFPPLAKAKSNKSCLFSFPRNLTQRSLNSMEEPSLISGRSASSIWHRRQCVCSVTCPQHRRERQSRCPHVRLVQDAMPQATGELVTSWAIRTATVNWIHFTVPLKRKALWLSPNQDEMPLFWKTGRCRKREVYVSERNGKIYPSMEGHSHFVFRCDKKKSKDSLVRLSTSQTRYYKHVRLVT